VHQLFAVITSAILVMKNHLVCVLVSFAINHFIFTARPCANAVSLCRHRAQNSSNIHDAEKSVLVTQRVTQKLQLLMNNIALVRDQISFSFSLFLMNRFKWKS